MSPEQVKKLLDKAIQLCRICADWNLEEVEIDDEMVNVRDLRDEFQEGYDNAG